MDEPGDGLGEVVFDAQVSNKAWHHVVVSVRRGASVTVYVDGNPGTTVTDTTSGALGSAASLLIGAGPGGPAFEGSVDEVAVYRSALSASRVAVHWRLGAQLDHGAPAVTLSGPVDGSSSVDATPTFSGTAGNGSTDASTVVVSITPDASAGPLETFESDEFGVPADPGYPHRYGWLGGKERSTELSSGVVQMGVRSYVPAIGRFLQVDPVLGGSANELRLRQPGCSQHLRSMEAGLGDKPRRHAKPSRCRSRSSPRRWPRRLRSHAGWPRGGSMTEDRKSETH